MLELFVDLFSKYYTINVSCLGKVTHNLSLLQKPPKLTKFPIKSASTHTTFINDVLIYKI